MAQSHFAGGPLAAQDYQSGHPPLGGEGTEA